MFHIVLFEPEIPPNTGNTIRLCANSGATLHLVKPLGFRLDDKSLQRSGLDYHDLAEVKVHANLQTCLDALEGARVFAVETSGKHRYSDVQFRAGDAFLFGPETRHREGNHRDALGRSAQHGDGPDRAQLVEQVREQLLLMDAGLLRARPAGTDRSWMVGSQW